MGTLCKSTVEEEEEEARMNTQTQVPPRRTKSLGPQRRIIAVMLKAAKGAESRIQRLLLMPSPRTTRRKVKEAVIMEARNLGVADGSSIEEKRSGTAAEVDIIINSIIIHTIITIRIIILPIEGVVVVVGGTTLDPILTVEL